MKLEKNKYYEMVNGQIGIKMIKLENDIVTYEKYKNGVLDGVYEMERRNFYINASNLKDFYHLDTFKLSI